MKVSWYPLQFLKTIKKRYNSTFLLIMHNMTLFTPPTKLFGEFFGGGGLDASGRCRSLVGSSGSCGG